MATPMRLCVYTHNTRVTHTHTHGSTPPHPPTRPYTPPPSPLRGTHAFACPVPHTPTHTHIRIFLCAYTHNAPGAGPRTPINILSLAFTHGLAYIHAHAHIHPRTHIGSRRLTLLAGSTKGSLLDDVPALPTRPAPAEIFAPECRLKCPRPAKSFKHFSRMQWAPLQLPSLCYHR